MKKNTATDMLSEIALEQNLTKKTVNKVYSSLVDKISKSLIKNEKIYLRGIGTFGVVNIKEKKTTLYYGKTDKLYAIPEHFRVTFSSSRSLRKALNNKIGE